MSVAALKDASEINTALRLDMFNESRGLKKLVLSNCAEQGILNTNNSATYLYRLLNFNVVYPAVTNTFDILLHFGCAEIMF